jgi:hypothetical protein
MIQAARGHLLRARRTYSLRLAITFRSPQRACTSPFIARKDPCAPAPGGFRQGHPSLAWWPATRHFRGRVVANRPDGEAARRAITRTRMPLGPIMLGHRYGAPSSGSDPSERARDPHDGPSATTAAALPRACLSPWAISPALADLLFHRALPPQRDGQRRSLA